MTNEQLSCEIRKSIQDFSTSLRPLIEEAARRLTAGQKDDSLKDSYRYGCQIIADIENEKPKT